MKKNTVKNTQNCIIVFMGPIGSGKSTHIHLLSAYLERKGIKTIKTCIKAYHLFVNLIIIFFTKLFKVGTSKKFHTVHVLFFYFSGLFRKIFIFLIYLDLFSILIKYLFRVYLPLKLGYCIIIEDYIFSTITDYIFILKHIQLSPHILKGFWLKILMKFFSARPVTMYIYLDAKNNVLFQRWKMRSTPYDMISYVEAQRKMISSLYKLLDNNKTILYIDTTHRDIREIQKLIYNSIIIFSEQKNL